MTDDLEYHYREQLRLEEDRKNIQFCAICERPLPERAAFCVHCDPPLNLKGFPVSRMSGFSAFYWIFFLLILFSGFFYYKEGGRWEDLEARITGLFQTEVAIPEEGVDPEEELKVVVTVNTPALNVRSEASVQSEILGVLSENEEVIVLERKEGWTQIRFKGQSGWVASRLLSSEIK